jgi:putative FmdB family regulatory protein
MPTYEFFCQKCDKPFERTFSLAEYEKAKKTQIKCPNCKSLRVSRQLSSFQVKTSKKS